MASQIEFQGEQRVNEPRIDPWLVLRTRSHHENTVESVLRQKQIIAYLPKHKVVRCWRERKRTLEVPLFPGYIFVQPRANQYEAMRYIQGSCGFVLANNKPAAMPEKDLHAVKMLVDRGVTLTVESALIVGKRVKIVTGPFAGVEGELVWMKNHQLLVINVDLVGGSVRMEVGREEISVI